jgi:hypothetical protein
VRLGPPAALYPGPSGHDLGVHADDRSDLFLHRVAAQPLSPAPWWRAGQEPFAIGITAAAMAYLVGVVLAGLLA